MDLFDLLTLGGGLAFFLYGMNVMSHGLEKLAGGKLEGILRSMTASPVKGMLLGALVTAVIQSSSAVTVMLVGLVNSGIMALGQTVGVIMGANIGTTITAWLLSLVSIQGGSTVMQLLKPKYFSLVLAMAVINNMISIYGAVSAFTTDGTATIPMAVQGIVMKFYQIVISVVVGMAAGCIPVVGYNFGAERYDRCRRMMEFDLKMEKLLSAPRTDFTKMTPETRTLLQNYYRDDKNKLAALLGKDLDALWYK